jgi:hypothetical protein
MARDRIAMSKNSTRFSPDGVKDFTQYGKITPAAQIAVASALQSGGRGGIFKKPKSPRGD